MVLRADVARTSTKRSAACRVRLHPPQLPSAEPHEVLQLLVGRARLDRVLSDRYCLCEVSSHPGHDYCRGRVREDHVKFPIRPNPPVHQPTGEQLEGQAAALLDRRHSDALRGMEADANLLRREFVRLDFAMPEPRYARNSGD